MKVRILFFFIFILLPLQSAEARQSVILGEVDQHDIITISEPESLKTYFGELKNSPHTFEIESKDLFNLTVHIAVPDIDEAQNNISGIILEVLKTGSVKEVARLRAKEADWNTLYEPIGGDRYRAGSSFERELAAGIYRVEISTPDNIGKYALTVGNKKGDNIGYLESVRDIARVKIFFGKSQFAVVQSPFVYVPLGILITILVAFVFILRFCFSKRIY